MFVCYHTHVSHIHMCKQNHTHTRQILTIWNSKWQCSHITSSSFPPQAKTRIKSPPPLTSFRPSTCGAERLSVKVLRHWFIGCSCMCPAAAIAAVQPWSVTAQPVRISEGNHSSESFSCTMLMEKPVRQCVKESLVSNAIMHRWQRKKKTSRGVYRTLGWEWTLFADALQTTR